MYNINYEKHSTGSLLQNYAIFSLFIFFRKNLCKLKQKIYSMFMEYYILLCYASEKGRENKENN